MRDPELLRRIEKAKSSQRLRDPQAELHDPIEDNPRVRAIIREVERRAEKDSLIQGMDPKLLLTRSDILSHSNNEDIQRLFCNRYWHNPTDEHSTQTKNQK